MVRFLFLLATLFSTSVFTQHVQVFDTYEEFQHLLEKDDEKKGQSIAEGEKEGGEGHVRCRVRQVVKGASQQKAL